MLLVRDLLVGPRRFGELQHSLRGIGTNLLASRLRELEAAGIVKRLEDGELRNHYGLTDAGNALEPSLLCLVRWGLAFGPRNQKGYHHQNDWDLLALKLLFRANRAGDLSVCVQFKTDEFAGWIAVHDQGVRIGLGEVDSADVTVKCTIKELFQGPHGAQLCSSGSKRTLKRFISAFAAPHNHER